jgi:hypothetical protein
MPLARHFAFFIFLSACSGVPLSSSFASGKAPKINQIEYLENLRLKRPELLRVDCKANLIAKFEFREPILNGGSISTLINKLYSKDQQKEDEVWASEYRKSAADLKAKVLEGYQVAHYYDPNDYAGYLVGAVKPDENKNLLTHPFIDKRGIGYKTYLEIKDFQKDLRPRSFQSFAQALARTGFKGDLKVQLAPGNARFKFNNIVVHCVSVADCLKAERTGEDFFGDKLAAIGRGVDVDIDPKGSEPAFDWSEYLCAKGTHGLPAEALSYVKYGNGF